MSEREYTPHQVMLLALHNSGAVIGRTGKTIDEIAELTGLPRDILLELVSIQVNSGYLEVSVDAENNKRYLLTGRGIIRVASLYT